MAEFKGAGSEASRATMLEKKRKEMMLDFQNQKDKIAKVHSLLAALYPYAKLTCARSLPDVNRKPQDKTVHIGADKFIAQNDWVDNELKRQTVGLVQLEDFQRIRESLDKQRQEDLERERLALLKQKRKKKKEKVKLSFDVDGEDGDVGEPMDAADQQPQAKKVKKNPTVDTSFLPDREREDAERLEREKLKEDWLEQQEKIKLDKILITYSYWDGTGHRTQVECRKGDTIAQFLENCRQQWHELRGVHVDNLMYVKEDLIVPHHYTFYDFIINKTRGKSGPLFAFDVHDDVRLVNDASIETEESHAGKILERAWYDKNKHIFPASRWEVFDPQKTYGNYTVKDRNKAKEAP